MEIYVEHYKDVTSLEIPQTEPSLEQTIPLPTPRTKKIIPDQTMEGTPSSRRDQEVGKKSYLMRHILNMDILKKSILQHLDILK